MRNKIMTKCNSERHLRRSIRIKDYDYSQAGAYFITICTQNKECLFGEIEHGHVVLSGAGEIAQSVWTRLPNRFPSVSLDEYVIMPNHVHGILLVGAQFIAPDSPQPIAYDPKDDAANYVRTLGEIVRAYKATVTRFVRTRNYAAADLNTTNQISTDAGGMNPAPTLDFGWQRNYYEHTIRNDDDLNQIREYIMQNPMKWDLDEENPIET